MHHDAAPLGTLEFRRPTPSELPAFLAVSIRSYGSADAPEMLAHEVLSNEIDRSFGAWEGGSCVAGSGAFSFEYTMPGGQVVPAAGVTMIGVEPTHRRRGILTTMLRQLHADAADRREPLALLTASETSIYRRFGYGIAADVAHLSIASDAVRFDPPLTDTGSFRLIDPHVDATELARVHDDVRRRKDGWLDLSTGMWEQIRADPTWNRDGRSPLRAVMHRTPGGEADGYATWRVRPRRDPDRLAGNTLFIEHLAATNTETEAALWAFLASIDLITSVEWECGPAEPTIRWRLVEPRQLRILARADMVWARLLDIPRALSTRTYGAPGTLDIDVTDRFHPELSGRYRVASDGRGLLGTGERVVSAEGPPDVTLDTADLASITVGSVAPSALADAGRIIGSPEAIDRADALFVIPRAPHWPIEF